jgi:hypothetical protein
MIEACSSGLQRRDPCLRLDTAYNTRVTVRVIDGDGKVSAYASVVDQKTQDPNYVNAQ